MQGHVASRNQSRVLFDHYHSLTLTPKTPFSLSQVTLWTCWPLRNTLRLRGNCTPLNIESSTTLQNGINSNFPIYSTPTHTYHRHVAYRIRMCGLLVSSLLIMSVWLAFVWLVKVPNLQIDPSLLFCGLTPKLWGQTEGNLWRNQLQNYPEH